MSPTVTVATVLEGDKCPNDPLDDTMDEYHGECDDDADAESFIGFIQITKSESPPIQIDELKLGLIISLLCVLIHAIYL